MQGSGSKPYILKNTGGVYSCSCPAWRNQSIDRHRKSHLVTVQFSILPTAMQYWRRTPGVWVPFLTTEVSSITPMVPRSSGTPSTASRVRAAAGQVDPQEHEQSLASEVGSLKHANADLELRDHVEQMRARCERELADPKLRLPQRKALTSLQEHWPGLTVFLEQPHVPLDNNKAERCHRGPVVARKNYYGSGALWSGQLTAMLFSLFQTLQAWGMDPGKWLTAYLTACAKAAGKPPPDPLRYLPWNMTAAERAAFSATKPKPPAPQPSGPSTQ
jgi:hypothetical protein